MEVRWDVVCAVELVAFAADGEKVVEIAGRQCAVRSNRRQAKACGHGSTS